MGFQWSRSLDDGHAGAMVIEERMVDFACYKALEAADDVVPTENLVGRCWQVILTEASVFRLVSTPNSNRR
jgi:hypothetical protein